MIDASGPYTFVDEIEVYRGLSPSGVPGRGPGGLRPPAVLRAVQGRGAHPSPPRQRPRRRGRGPSPGSRRGRRSHLRSRPKPTLSSARAPPSSRASLPTSARSSPSTISTGGSSRCRPLSSGAGRAPRARLVAVEEVGRPPAPTARPTPGIVAVDVALRNDEYRSAAFNLSNAEAIDAEVTISVVGLPGDQPRLRRRPRGALHQNTVSGVLRGGGVAARPARREGLHVADPSWADPGK